LVTVALTGAEAPGVSCPGGDMERAIVGACTMVTVAVADCAAAVAVIVTVPPLGTAEGAV